MLDKTIYVYDDALGHHEITLERAAPEWCNADCASIQIVSDDPRIAGYILNNGTMLEDVPMDIAWKFADFVVKSAKACYKKYPRTPADSPWRDLNGFVMSFIRQNWKQKRYAELVEELAEREGYTPWLRQLQERNAK